MKQNTEFEITKPHIYVNIHKKFHVKIKYNLKEIFETNLAATNIVLLSFYSFNVCSLMYQTATEKKCTFSYFL